MKSYKGHSPRIEYDESIEKFTGRILGIRDVITFQGDSIDEVKRAFHEAVDDYLAWSAEEGTTPQKP